MRTESLIANDLQGQTVVYRVPKSGLAAVAAVAILTGGCRQEIQFTRVPFAGGAEKDARPNETTVFLSVPMQLGAVLTASEAALGEQIVRAKDQIDDMACDRRKGPWLECMTATVTTDITRAGPISLALDGNKLLLTVPIKYVVNARGLGWSQYLADGKVGRTTVSVPLEVSVGAGYKLDVKVGNDLTWGEKTVSVLKGKVQLPRIADAKIKSQLKAATEPIRQALAEQPVRDAAGRAWRALYTPIELTRSPSLWLRGAPERIYGAGFSVDGERIVYNLGIDARIGVQRGERPAPLFTKALPEPSKTPAGTNVATQQTLLRLPIDVSIKALDQVVAAAFPKADVIETRADSKTAPIKVKVAASNLFPSRDKLGLELELDVVEPRRMFGLTGKAYLLGKPVLDADTNVIEITDVAFPAVPPKEAKTRQNVLRIGEEPFAGRFTTAARLDIGGEVRELLPRVNAMINQRLDETIDLVGKFDTAVIASLDPVRDALRLNVELTGTLMLRSGPTLKAAQTAPVQPTEPVPGMTQAVAR